MPSASIPLRPAIGSFIMVLVGACIAISGWLWKSTLDNFVRQANKTEGVVVGIEMGKRSSDRFPVFKFSDVRGAVRSAKSSYPLARVEVGDTITVAYNPSDPADAVIADAVTGALGPYVLIGFGLAFTAIGIYAGTSNSLRQNRR